ncbi:baseplate hub subunit [Serratia phage X20]|uniref:Baseplate hub subunit n=3 Tax=Winklervirus TaxID=2560256 RepID=A0A1Z1LZC3_9CAUD|nr:baseplate hub [Serratia phage CHI14]YP_010092346.1 baseplate hub [Serratia phage X20]ARW57890.1 baseplate hub subunit [Serratia phage CBH8]QYN80637.1 baseplate hub subunit [Kosakonia phage Kc304]UJJ22183.1 baseplate hub assembly protein [Erwinia phage Virsaitis27]UYM28846.1 baseplate hub subunit [Serratia phage vB_SspM_LC53]ARW57615.1 baseplate hub subunit [Serratia phage CHI14]
MNFEYKFTVHVSDKVVNCRAFTLREYKNLMEAKLKGTIDQAIKDLIKKCTDAQGLNRQESELLLIKLWAYSLGEVNHEHTWVCSCGREQEVPLNFTHAQIDEPSAPLVWEFENFKVKFKYPELFDDSNIAMLVAKCIEFIDVDGSLIKVDDLSDAELDDLYSAISSEALKDIAAMLLKPKVVLAVPISCECGESNIHVIEGLKEFFKLL